MWCSIVCPSETVKVVLDYTYCSNILVTSCWDFFGLFVTTTQTNTNACSQSPVTLTPPGLLEAMSCVRLWFYCEAKVINALFKSGKKLKVWGASSSIMKYEMLRGSSLLKPHSGRNTPRRLWFRVGWLIVMSSERIKFYYWLFGSI